MTKETIIELLKDIENHGLLGVNRSDEHIMETIRYTLDKGYLERTDHGNFVLTEKGYALLDKAMKRGETANYDTTNTLIAWPGNSSYWERKKMIDDEQKKLKKIIAAAIIILILILIGVLVAIKKFV
jgi:hypothetical protein